MGRCATVFQKDGSWLLKAALSHCKSCPFVLQKLPFYTPERLRLENHSHALSWQLLKDRRTTAHSKRKEMRKIGIIVAMDKEFRQLEGLLEAPVTEEFNHKTFVSGQAFGNEIILMQCGIGKVNSAIGAVEMIDNYHPDLVVSSGVAGGASTALNVTEVVVGTEYAYHDAYCGSECEYGQVMGMPPKFHSPAQLVADALAIRSETPIHAGLIVSGEWFVDSREKMVQILNNFPEALAVDMESCSIAQVCHIYHTPFISFRIISDVPLKDNKAAQYYDFWERMAQGSFNVTKQFLERLAL